jgi:hypothetical protein
MWPWLLGIGCSGVLLLGALAAVAFVVFGKAERPSFLAFLSRSENSENGDAEQEADEPNGEEQPEDGALGGADAQETEMGQMAPSGQAGDGQAAQARQAASGVTAAAPELPMPMPNDAWQQQEGPQTVTVPMGTKIVVTLNGPLSTSTHNANDSWQGTLAQAVTVDGRTVWPAGARVSGVVQQSAPTGKLSNGKGVLGIQLTRVGRASIDGGVYSVIGEPKTDRNAKVIGATAAAGALVGALSSKKNKADHALGGAAIGAAAGTGIAAATADTTIKMPATVTFALPSDERVAPSNR